MPKVVLCVAMSIINTLGFMYYWDVTISGVSTSLGQVLCGYYSCCTYQYWTKSEQNGLPVTLSWWTLQEDNPTCEICICIGIPDLEARIYVLICVGLAVDYAAHIAHMFREHRSLRCMVQGLI